MRIYEKGYCTRNVIASAGRALDSNNLPAVCTPLAHDLRTVGSLFAGIGGFDLGFERAGFRSVWQVEKELFCRSILQCHFPNAQLFEDVCHVGSRELAPVSVICAGVPCQDVSVAGKRAGLAGERTGLFYEFARILRELRPAWFVFENVPGLLSSNGGRDFAEILRVLMVECGYGVQWRVLNSQFFGVAQRRRRVFLVGRFGKPCPAEILFESDCGERNSSTRRTARTRVTAEVARSITQSCFKRHDEDTDTLIAAPLSAGSFDRSHAPGRRREDDFNLVATLNSGGFRTEPGEHIVIQDVRGRRDSRQNGIGIQEGGPSYSLTSVDRHAVAFAENQRGELRTSSVSPQLSCAGGKPGSGYSAAICPAPDADGVREFTGLPKGLDGARYRALGNAVTVNVIHYIASRIAETSHV